MEPSRLLKKRDHNALTAIRWSGDARIARTDMKNEKSMPIPETARAAIRPGRPT